jgi:hypothetical protein
MRPQDILSTPHNPKRPIGQHPGRMRKQSRNKTLPYRNIVHVLAPTFLQVGIKPFKVSPELTAYRHGALESLEVELIVVTPCGRLFADGGEGGVEVEESKVIAFGGGEKALCGAVGEERGLDCGHGGNGEDLGEAVHLDGVQKLLIC